MEKGSTAKGVSTGISEAGQRLANDDGSDADGLRRRHRDLERRLAALDRHLSLTPDEQMERARLKKEKLWVKDRMLALGVLGTGQS